MLVLDPVKVVGPNTAIDKYYLSPRISFRSPSHFTRPRSLRMSCCWLCKSSSLSHCSTYYFLVLHPDDLRAASIKLSSITMLVLMNDLLVCIAKNFIHNLARVTKTTPAKRGR